MVVRSALEPGSWSSTRMLKISCSMKVSLTSIWVVAQLMHEPLSAYAHPCARPVLQAVSQVDGKDLDPDNITGKKFQSLKEDRKRFDNT